MIGLLQRVTQSQVQVDKQIIAKIDTGLLVLIGIQPFDNKKNAEKLLKRILGYRIFEDQEGKMNQSLTQINGGLLLVPQFTLAADTTKGLRPGFSTAASPTHAKSLFYQLIETAQSLYPDVQHGQFGANMQVSLINDGPATFYLKVE